MKKSLLRVIIALAGVAGASGLAAAFAVGCGGDDSDGGAVTDGGGDESRPDARDTGAPDGDAGTDTGSEGDADAGRVCDGAPSVTEFNHAANDAFCGRMRTCCLVTDPKNWNQEFCTTIYDSVGGFQYWGQYEKYLDAGGFTYDQCKATDCLRDLDNVFCGKLTSADILAIRKECNEAIVGNVAVGGDCVATIQCKQGLFCQTAATDGGAGKCAPLLNQGQSCAQYTDPVIDQACAYRGLGLEKSALYCDTSPDAGVCVPVRADDAGCSGDPQCASGVCAYGTCSSEIVLADPLTPGGFCDVFTIKDGG